MMVARIHNFWFVWKATTGRRNNGASIEFWNPTMIDISVAFLRLEPKNSGLNLTPIVKDKIKRKFLSLIQPDIKLKNIAA